MDLRLLLNEVIADLGFFSLENQDDLFQSAAHQAKLLSVTESDLKLKRRCLQKKMQEIAFEPSRDDKDQAEQSLKNKIHAVHQRFNSKVSRCRQRLMGSMRQAARQCSTRCGGCLSSCSGR